MDVKEAIVKVVEEHQGLKATELVVKIFDYVTPSESSKVLDAIQELVENGELVEIEYTLPKMAYRTKSFLLPKGTVAYKAQGKPTNP
jgi:predicted DNA-binding transcriptional regulator YafY